MQLINRDGASFWVLIEKEKVNSLRKWDQAFHIYAAVYSKANPHRSHEIWQYMQVITTAAASYVWENMSEYDTTFRQLMAAYPQCSWAKIYTQMWNLAMKEPIIRSHFGNANKQNWGNRSASQSQKEGRDRYCWKFNKNKCKSRNCDYEHRCKYCDAWGHGFYNCYKKLAAKSNSNNNNNNTNSSNAVQNAQSDPSDCK